MANRKGKYAAVIEKLPKLPGVEVERREVVEAVKQEVRDAVVLPHEHGGSTMSVRAEAENAEAAIVDAITVLKHSCAGKPYASEFARAYAEARALREKVKEWDASVGLLVEAFQWLMIEQMEVEGVTALRLSNGQPVSTYLEPYATVTDRDAYRRWCLSDPDLARRMEVPWNTTNALTKARLLAGEPEPDGVTVWAKTKVRLGAE